MGKRTTARGLIAALAVVSACAVDATPAWAHSAFVGSTPEPGTRLQASPRRVVLNFTEPLNLKLSYARLVAVHGGAVVRARTASSGGRRLVVAPRRTLARGPYRVEWHTVSVLDGHVLEGSFSFGVRAAAAGGEHTVQQGPLARHGWLRVIARVALYASLLMFCAGLLLGVILGRGRRGSWLVPEDVGGLGELDRRRLSRRPRAIVVAVGWIAAVAVTLAVLADAGDAAGGLSLRGLGDFLFTDVAGWARVALVALVVGAAALARRRSRAAALAGPLSLGALAASGHAGSASPRVLSILNDWVHLNAAALWLGGMALIVCVWGPHVASAESRLLLAVAREVLPRFGRVAIPAFGVVVVTGALSALIELGHLSALWDTGYGRILLVKISLVGLIASVSYTHALRLRPRLLATNPHPPPVWEQRHWQLLRSEPMLALGVVGAVAFLVAYPLPPRELRGGEEPSEPTACAACNVRLPAATELTVADHAGSALVAVWMRREGDRLRGHVRLLDPNARPIDEPFRIVDARQSSCGPGCATFTTRATPMLRVRARERGHSYTASLPARWLRAGNVTARRLLDRTLVTMRALRSLRMDEAITSGPGIFVTTLYRFEAPDRLAYRLNNGAASVIIGRSQWSRAPGGSWTRDSFGGGFRFTTASFFVWRQYAGAVRLLDVRRQGQRRVADLALMSTTQPAWDRLRIDLGSMRTVAEHMTAQAHFMTRRYYAFNRPLAVRAPNG